MVRISPLEIPSEQPNDCAMVGNYIVRYWCCRTISSARFWKARSLAGARSAAQDVPDANQLLPTTRSAAGLLFQEGAQQGCDTRFLADDRFIMLRGGLALGHLCKLCGQHTHGGVSTDVGSFLRRNCHPARRVPAQLPSHFFAPPLEVSSVAGDAHVRINLQMRPSFVSLCFYSLNAKLVNDHDQRFYIERLCRAQTVRSDVAQFRDSVEYFRGGRTSLLGRD